VGETVSVPQHNSPRRYSLAAWSFGSRVGAAIGFAVTSAILSRKLGAEDFGRYSVAVSVGLFGSLVVAGGLNRVLLRDIAAALASGETDRARSAVSEGMRLLVVLTPLGAAISIVISAGLTRSGWQLPLATGVFAAAQGLLLVASDVLRGLGEHRMANLAAGRNGGVAVLGLFAVLLLPAAWGETATEAVALNALAAVAALVVAVGACGSWIRRQLGPLSQDLSPRGRSVLLVAAVPFAVIHLAQLLVGQVDLWIAERALSGVQTGLYASAVRLMALISLPLQAAQLALVAGVSALYVLGKTTTLEFRVRRAATVAAVPAVAGFAICVVAAGPVLGLLFGDEFRNGSTILVILAAAQVVQVLTGLCGIVLAMTGHERVVLGVSVVAAIAAVILDWIGATLWGGTGLALASATTTSLMFTSFWILARTRTGIRTHPYWPTRKLLAEPTELVSG
jgi:O-antigen/teichoic acid export membrane protein